MSVASKANNKYRAKAYDTFSFVVKKGKKEVLQDYAKSLDISMNEFVKQAVKDKVYNDFGTEIDL